MKVIGGVRMEQLIKDNRYATRRSFNEYFLFICGIVSGPIIMTLLTVVNMAFLHVGRKKRWMTLLVGIVLSFVYLMVIRYFDDQIVRFSVMFASGAGIYQLYRKLADDEIHIFETLISNDQLQVIIFPFYGAGLLTHVALRLLAEVFVV
jgi:hypothetical protein